jgi:aminopeptidase N
VALRGPDRYVPSRGSAAYRVLHYDLDLDVRVATGALTGTAVLTVQAREDLDRVELDLASALSVDGVRVDGARPARYRHAGDRLVVSLRGKAKRKDRLAVEVRWSGRPRPSDGRWGEVGWEELTDGVLVAGQPDGAHTWYPCNDVPADKASYRTVVRVDSAYAAVVPGRLVSRKAGGSRTTWTYDQPEPTPAYLMTLQVGRYEEHVLAEGPVLQKLWSPPRLRARARKDTARSPRMLAVFEGAFGPYPFGSYTLVVTDDDLEIPLEAQGLSVLGAQHVDGEGGSERLVAHELAHSWFGNSLTAATWSEIWLHEGPACYAEWLWSEVSGGRSADRHAAHWYDRLAALPQDLVLADPGPDLMFDDRLYKRGALALHAVRRSVGDEAFFALLRDWVAEHRHGSVTTEQLVDHVRDAAGRKPALLLRRWVEHPALPDR